MDAVERRQLKEMAVNAMTGHLKVDDPIYELGKRLERAIEALDDRDACEVCNECPNHGERE